MRAFVLLLRLVPREFRARYGAEMTELFLRRLERARERAGWMGAARAWARMGWDVLRAAVAERVGTNLGEGGGDRSMGTVLQDFRYAARRLAHAPLFTLAAAGILAVGIGANAAAFSVADALFFRPPPYARPDEVVSVYQDSDEGEPNSTAYPAYEDIARSIDVFAGVAATSPEVATWESPTGPVRVAIQYATASYLPLLGLEPSRGRWFAPEEDQVGAGLVAVLTAQAWRSRFGAAPDLVGKSVRLNGHPVTIVGIGPERFNGDAGALIADFWLSISSTPVGGPYRVTNLSQRGDHWYDVKARLAPGVSVERAQDAMTALARAMGEAYPEIDRGRDITVFSTDQVRLHPDVDGELMGAGAGLLGVVGLVLILACANLANLILARGASRTAEVAVRRALGASAARVAMLFLAEALLLAALGGLGGLLLARAAIALFPLLPIDFPGGARLDLIVDRRVLAYLSAIAVATGVVFGLAPTLRARRLDVAGPMRTEGRSALPSRSAGLVRQTLVGVQVAISLVLVTGAGLAARSLARARTVDPGFDPAPLVVVGTDLSQAGFAPDAVAPARDELLRRVRALPGVASASLVSRLPVEPGGSTTTVIEGYEPGAGTGAVEFPFGIVGEEYFATLGVPVLAGHGFGPNERAGMPRAVVVNETAAGRYFGGDAVGKRIRPQGAPDAWRTVIGVVADVKVGSVQEPPTPMFFFSAEQVSMATFSIVVRGAGDAEALLGPLREELRAVAPTAPATRLITMEDHLGGTLAEARAAASVLGGFSLLALVLASLGVYAMVAFSVAGRAAELGVRMAMGAARPRLVAMVVTESLVPVAAGLAVGLALALGVAPAAAGLLYGIGARDPITVGGSVLLLALVALAASLLPAWRAASADPVAALRAR